MSKSAARIIGASALLAAGAALAVEADPPPFWGHPMADGGKCCASLKDARAHIDLIDREIIAGMAARAQYVAEAGRFKKDPAAVSDPARVEAIILRVRKVAAADGLSPDVADKTFRAMIGAFEDYERATVGKRRSASP